MAYQVQIGNTTRDIPFLIKDVTDHITGKPGVTPSVVLKKNGSDVFVPAQGTVVPAGFGVCSLRPDPDDADVLGPCVLHVTGTASIDPVDDVFEVVSFNPDTTATQTGDSFARIGATGSGLTSITTPIAALPTAAAVAIAVWGFVFDTGVTAFDALRSVFAVFFGAALKNTVGNDTTVILTAMDGTTEVARSVFNKQDGSREDPGTIA